MDRELLFSKHHGLGNDFLVLLDMADAMVLSRSEIVALLNRRTGIGADGLLHITPASVDSPSVARMSLFNSDGSRAEMSGNGIRCLAQALIDSGSAPLGLFSIDTDAGVIEIESHSKLGDPVAQISVGMGMPVVKEVGVRTIDGVAYRSARVDIGNPHLVLIPSSDISKEFLDEVNIALLGPSIEAEFQEGMNVEWILPAKNRREMHLRVWERGAGATLACGTGSTASSFAAHSLGLVDEAVVVHNPGGDLEVRIAGQQCYLTGPAQKVCEVSVTAGQLEAMVALFK